MTKTAVSALAIAGALVFPLTAGAEGKPEHPGKSHAPHGLSKKCKAHNVGYSASGSLAAPATLTQVAGAETPTDTADDRYSGTLSVTVTKANRHARGAVNPQSYTVSHIRLGDGVTASAPAGTRVKVIGKITKINKKCDQSGAGVVTIRKAVLRMAVAS